MDQNPAQSEPTQTATLSYGKDYLAAYAMAHKNMVKGGELKNTHPQGSDAHRGWEDGSFDGKSARGRCLRGETPWSEMEKVSMRLTSQGSQ
jgi:hypothetical protein